MNGLQRVRPGRAGLKLRQRQRLRIPGSRGGRGGFRTAGALATDKGGGDGGGAGGREGPIIDEDELLRELESKPEIQALLDMVDQEMDKGPEFFERTLRAIMNLGGENDEMEEEDSARRPQRGFDGADDEEDEEEEDDGTVETLTPSARLRREFGGELPSFEDFKREMFGNTEAEDFGKQFGNKLPRRLRLNPEAEDFAGLLEEGDAMMYPHPDEFDPSFNYDNFGFGIKVQAPHACLPNSLLACQTLCVSFILIDSLCLLTALSTPISCVCVWHNNRPSLRASPRHRHRRHASTSTRTRRRRSGSRTRRRPFSTVSRI